VVEFDMNKVPVQRRNPVNSSINQLSWSCIFAADGQEFEKYWRSLKNAANGTGYLPCLDDSRKSLEELKNSLQNAQ
ncbi:MAG: hypothetical protein IKN24_02090, partial [Lachnospiraceae bacterium]|nr:hypothetical protein [Lachnospiraceae bacterium]